MQDVEFSPRTHRKLTSTCDIVEQHHQQPKAGTTVTKRSRCYDNNIWGALTVPPLGGTGSVRESQDSLGYKILK